MPIAAPFVLVLVFITVDIAADLIAGASWLHVSGETAIVGLAALGLAALARHALATRTQLEAEVRGLRGINERWQNDALRWEAEARTAVRGFSDAVNAEFERWHLTTAEREVALLLLKGMSLKEVAGARGTSERTVRQQAATVYSKAGVEGRAELASYFLDALTLPEIPPTNSPRRD